MKTKQNGKRLLAGAMSLLAAVSMTGVTCFALPDTEAELINVAAGKTVFTTSSYDDSVWGAA